MVAESVLNAIGFLHGLAISQYNIRLLKNEHRRIRYVSGKAQRRLRMSDMREFSI